MSSHPQKLHRVNGAMTSLLEMDRTKLQVACLGQSKPMNLSYIPVKWVESLYLRVPL